MMFKPVIEAMTLYMDGTMFGNPDSMHSYGLASKRAVEQSRKQVADFLHCDVDNVIFTSGGSEANNMVFEGSAKYLLSHNKHEILFANIEHDSVINAIKNVCEKYEGNIYYNNIPVTEHCEVDCDALERMITPDTGIVSVMFVNNETGAVNNVQKIAEICHKSGVLFHTDCVQAASCYDLDVDKIGCDFLSVSAHKINGPKGVGCLYVRNKDLLTPIICGGADQEYGLRGGTSNVPGIVGFGVACSLCKRNFDIVSRHICNLKHGFIKALDEEIPGKFKLNCMQHQSNSGIVNVCIDGIDSETAVLMLDAEGFCVSAGSACRSHESTPSKTLLECGIDEEDARNSIRVSFGATNKDGDDIMLAKAISKLVKTYMGRDER